MSDNTNPFEAYIGSRRGQKYPPQTLAEGDIDKLIGACNRRAASGCRDAALIAVMVGAGLRVSEALGVRPCDLKGLEHGTASVVVRKGKGNKSRTTGIRARYVPLIAAWVERHSALGMGTRTPLFAVIKTKGFGEALGYHTVRTMLARRSRKVGLEPVRAHSLRHSFSVAIARAAVPVVHLQRALGHANLSVTSRYLQTLDPAETVEAISAV